MMRKYRICLAAVITAAALFTAGCGGGAASAGTAPPMPTETESAAAATVTETETTTRESEAVTEEDTTPAETEEYPKGENSVRTAEELAGKKVIALTFDDGPNTGVTNEILDVIEEYGIKASFFVIGQNIDPESAKAMQRAHSLGCEINSHSFTHSYMDQMSAEDIADEMERTSELIYEYVGEYPKFFRPPYIAVNTTMYDTIDLPFIAGIGCNDWEDRVSVEKRVRFLTEKCPEGCIILMHDAKDNEKTAEAVRQAVPMMLEQGFEFVTVSELFAAKGITPAADKEITYSYATENGWS